ncbi:BrnT family toxin [bacterium]|nr:BrnT family toxin [bacterium]
MKVPLLLQCTGFDWDEGNISKNWRRHRVSPLESEQIFFNKPLLIARDLKHSRNEERYYALGITDNERYLFTVFTLRDTLIRIISSRDMNRNERNIYENQREKTDT